MKALVYTGTEQMEYQDYPDPQGEFLVKVLGCAVCGTDLKTYLHGHPYFVPPTILGHEFYGQVAKAPAESGYVPGDYVVVAPYGECGVCETCRKGIPALCQNKSYTDPGAFSEMVSVPLDFVERGVIRLDGPDAVYALTEPLSCVLTGINQLEIRQEDRVLIIGGGPMGTLAAMTLDDRGVKVVVGELNPLRRAKLAEWGIESHTLEECYQEKPYDKIIVAVNIKKLVEEAVTKVADGGKVHVFAGLPSGTVLELPARDLHYRYVQVMGSSGFSIPAFHEAFERIRKNPERFRNLITHRFPLKDGQAAMQYLKKGEAFKILLEP